ncbi:MAG: LPS export ABC transporter periplasmic protein LptC [Bacteroidetes bacterium]|nr:MAG: LPS export ABC transporter periplasmic protein LptC [Bacteroidota bacterium]
MLILSTTIFFCENKTSDIDDLISKMEIGKEMAEEVEILYSDAAIVRARIVAPVMIMDLDRSSESQEFPEGVVVDFFDDFQNGSSTLSGLYAIRYIRKGQVIVRDSVVWESVTGEKLETQELIWDEKAEKIYSDKFVVISRPSEIIYGHGFEAGQDFNNARVKAVEGRITLENE